MRSLLLAAAFALVVTAPVTVAQDPPKKDKADKKAAKKFVSEEGRYKIAFPGKPMLQEQKVPTAAGELVVHMAILEKDEAAYIVSWNMMPKGTKDVNAEKVLDGTEKGVIQDGKKISSKLVEFGPKKLPAREVVWDAKAGFRFKALLILKDERLYQVLFGGTKEQVASDEAKAFAKSLELIDEEK